MTKGYDADWFRAVVAGREITPCIPSKASRKVPIPYDPALHRQRYKIENMFGRLKDWRRIHTRCDRCAHLHVSHLRRRNRHLLAQSMSPELRSLSWWLSFVRSASSRASRSEIRCFFCPISQPFGHSSLSPRYKGRLHCTSILDEAFVLTIVTVKKVSLPCDRRNLIGSGLAADRSRQDLSSGRTRFWRPSRDARVSCAAAKLRTKSKEKGPTIGPAIPIEMGCPKKACAGSSRELCPRG